MKKQDHMLSTLLALVLAVLLLAAVLVRTFFPIVIIPRLDIPMLVLISLVALLAERYLAPGARRCWPCVAVLAALTFGLLPWAACFTWGTRVWVLAAVGGAVFTVTAWLFTSVCDRLASGPSARLAPWVSALGLYLAAQGLMAVIL